MLEHLDLRILHYFFLFSPAAIAHVVQHDLQQRFAQRLVASTDVFSTGNSRRYKSLPYVLLRLKSIETGSTQIENSGTRRYLSNAPR